MPIFSFHFSDLFKKFFRPKRPPLVIEDELGTFIMKNPATDNAYEGTIPWLGQTVVVNLEVDDMNALTADKTLASLRQLAANAAGWDEKIRQYAADDFAGSDGLIAIWGSAEEDDDGGESDRITREEFMRRLSIGFIYLYADGGIFFDYDLDDMFTDHGLGINADISGRIDSCALWG